MIEFIIKRQVTVPVFTVKNDLPLYSWKPKKRKSPKAVIILF